MHIQNISLIGFKNYDALSLQFSRHINCFVGPNGSGKTNLLDAIHYLSLTKSAFNSVDSQNIKSGQKIFSVKGTFSNEDKTFEVLCALQSGEKKIVKVDKKEYAKLSQHIGKVPVVLIEPNDTDLIRNTSEVRRRFFDSIISQIDPSYLDNLIKYNANLKQRNALLKQFTLANKLDEDLLEPYTHQLLSLGKSINVVRMDFVRDFSSFFLRKHSEMARAKEEVDLQYSSEFSEANYEQAFRNNLKRELIMERTLSGIHKDDYKFTIYNRPIKKYGSQGQQKSYVIALKLAQFHLIKEHKGFKPILLLDDIFDKLDNSRVENLINLIVKEEFGQIFITDAQNERINSILKELAVERFTFTVEDSFVEKL